MVSMMQQRGAGGGLVRDGQFGGQFGGQPGRQFGGPSGGYGPGGQPQYAYDPMRVQQKPSNPLAILAMVAAVLALAGGCVSCVFPVIAVVALAALMLSVVALFKRPRTMASFALIFSLIAVLLCGLGVALHIMFKATGGLKEVVKVALVHNAIDDYQRNNAAFPKDLQTIAGKVPPGFLQDRFGHDWIYKVEANGTGYSLTGAGADGVAGTSDDALFEFLQEGTRSNRSVPMSQPKPKTETL